jgi:hypothetical protein
LLLSGDKLVDRQDFRDQLCALEPEAIGGEMEGAGLYAVAKREKVDWILVKAICDYADGNKAQDKDKRQQTAARNAARFVFHVLRQGGFVTDQGARQQLAQHHIYPARSDVSVGGNVGTFQPINISGGSVQAPIIGQQNNYVGQPQLGASASQKEIDQQRKLLELYRQTLASYLRRLAQLGSAHAPPEIDHGMHEARDGILRCKSTLRTWGVGVDDHPDDEPQSLGSSIVAP